MHAALVLVERVGSLALLVVAVLVVLSSLHGIGPTEIGLVRKRWGLKKLSADSLVAFNGEPGYQADLLMPGWRFKLSLLFSVGKHPMPQVPANEIAIVISQVGKPLPSGARSGIYKDEFGNFTDLRGFVTGEGERGLQRHVLPPNASGPVHPVGFIVVTKKHVYGVPIAPELEKLKLDGTLNFASFGLEERDLNVVRIEPKKDENGRLIDMIGIVTTYEGQSLEKGDIASRIGEFTDIAQLEGKAVDDPKKGEAPTVLVPSESAEPVVDAQLIDAILSTKNSVHDSYQNFQKFLQAGGRIGLQHDPLLYGSYLLNPMLVKVEQVPMLVVEQGEVYVIKSYVGLPAEDVSGEQFKFGAIVRPGHRGIWRDPFRTGKYAVNPRCYAAVRVPTFIITLNWAEAQSQAHDLDKNLSSIEAISKEGFKFVFDLQVQIHVPDTQAPYVISMVGTMEIVNLGNAVKDGHVKVAPDVLVLSGSNGGSGLLDGVLAAYAKSLSRDSHDDAGSTETAVATTVAPAAETSPASHEVPPKDGQEVNGLDR